VTGHDTSKIRNIWAVGRNYADHARELGNAVPTDNSAPMIFLKAGSTIVENGATFALPALEGEIHYETEIALRFGPDFNFDGITVALDLTARELQDVVKKEGKPWTIAKSFQRACPIGPIVPLPSKELQSLTFSLRVNGDIRQRGDARDMIHSIEKMRAYVLATFPVCPGDLLLTGTPKGVGPLKAGDKLEAEIDGVVQAHWQIR
jgi:2-keto-4-pentenoate hydratase/2-oxohepta-3-ene-1,7-dioic acid hydratase in catechol pathway